MPGKKGGTKVEALHDDGDGAVGHQRRGTKTQNNDGDGAVTEVPCNNGDGANKHTKTQVQGNNDNGSKKQPQRNNVSGANNPQLCSNDVAGSNLQTKK
jgi:hypothetical protein